LRKLRAEFDRQIRIAIVGAGDYRLEDVLAEYQPWSLEEEVKRVQQFDIGIMPMPDNSWTRGKCGFKALQYMSVGIPVVCSPVGMNHEIVVHGENGFLAEGTSQWYQSLRRLVEAPELRRLMGQRSRQTVEEKFSLECCAQRFEKILCEIAAM